MNAPSPHQILRHAGGREVRSTVLGLFRGHMRLAAAATITLLVTNITALIAPAVLGRIVDLVVDGAAPSALTAPTVLLVVAAIATSVTLALGTALIAQLGEAMLATLRERVVTSALEIPVDLVERAGTGDLIARVSTDVSTVSTTVRQALPAIIGAGLTVGLTIVGLGILDWRFALAMASAMPIQALTLRWYLRTSGPVYTAEAIGEGALTQSLFESFDGGPTIRAFRLQDRHMGQVRDRSQAVVSLGERAGIFRTWFYGWLNAAEFVGMAAILVTGFLLVRAGAVTLGEATAAALYFHRLFDPINVLLGLVDEIQAAIPALARLVGVASLAPPADRRSGRRPADASLALAGVTHAYEPGHDVLTDLTLRVSPGEHLAIVGASGAGKTTVAKIVAGAVVASQGEVLVGGTPLSALSADERRRAVALVSQEVHVFAGTLADDLRLARPGATDDDLLAALGQVGAADWLPELTDGLDTPVGAGGFSLTATRAQQVAIARLLLADRPIVILDEATAEGGSAGARLLERAANRAIEGRTAIIVAHRLAQAATADRVVLMKAGRIVESGTHEELLAAGGTYADLWAAWSSGR